MRANSAGGTMKQFTVFRAGEEEFGIDIHRVVEIVNPVRRYVIPDMPDFFSAVISLRGTVIPILDVRKRFHMAIRPERERIIIVWVGRQMVGLMVDSVREITGFSDDEIIAPPSLFKGLKPEYLIGLGKKEDRVIILLNTDSILTAEEKIELIESGKKMEMSLDHGSAETPEER